MQLRDYKWYQAQPAPEVTAGPNPLPGLIVRRLGLQDYDPIFKSMRYLAERNIGERAQARDDEIWLLSHKPVYTQGQAGKPQHILNPAGIPVVQIDRGGQVTYHGPGQLVAYLLLNVKRRRMGVRQLVDLIEQSIVATLAELGIQAAAKPEAPGVYVKDSKVAALGLRIRNGLSYHGLSLNVNMDLGPFANINPCGFENLAVTQIKDLVNVPQAELDSGELMRRVSRLLSDQLLERLGYQAHYRLQEAS